MSKHLYSVPEREGTTKSSISEKRIEMLKVKPKKGNLLDRLIKKMIDKRK